MIILNRPPAKTAVFDLEIKKPIEECTRGWASHDEMGIATLCLYDYSTERYRVFDDVTQGEAVTILCEYDVVAGYNTVRFDWAVVRATWSEAISKVQRRSIDHDILRQIWIAIGADPDNFQPRTHGGFKLDQIALETIGMRKTLDGAKAPLLYQKGHLTQVVDYCLEDVRIERTLYEFALRNGYIIQQGRKIPITFPALPSA